MSAITIRFIGSGDAFASGGRLQTCILVDAPQLRFAIDFGATSLVGLRRQGIDPNSIDAILLTHLHGDHCGGVPFLLLDAMLGAKRSSPLTIVGPADVEARLRQVQSALFPGSEGMAPRFDLTVTEMSPERPLNLLGLNIRAIHARHTQQTHPLALRIGIGGQSIAYTGDGELTNELIELVRDVDLLIAECYFFSKAVKWHLNYPDIAHLPARRVVLTHMHSDMLAHVDEVPQQCAYDGCVIEVEATPPSAR